jgi:hypothetical protein
MESFLEEIRSNVCSHCIDANEMGRCTLPSESRCPMELYPKMIVRAIGTVHSDKYPEYVSALRTHVCRHCTYGSLEDCALRTQLDCALDRYYPMVIDVVEGFVDANQTSTVNY